MPRFRCIAAVFSLALAVVLAFGGVLLERASRVDCARLRLAPCRIFYDRSGRILRFAPNAASERHLWVDLGEIPECVQNAFLAAEDKRFYEHHGVDFRAIARALKDNVAHRRVVSGASTITQQLVRMAYPKAHRGLREKCIEALMAMRLDAALGKDEILALYLNRVPLGNNLYGVEAASLFYFGKPCRSCSTAEAAVLASLPKAPSALRPNGKNRARLLARKDWVLSRMRLRGLLGDGELREETARPIFFQELHFPMEAPHAVDALAADAEREGRTGAFHTTIDLDLQERLDAILLSHRARLLNHGASQAAAVILDNADVSVLALTGSLDYSARDGGYNNGALALRSPGSALKPFLYALALDGDYTAASILEDVPARYSFAGGIYRPLNFDRKTHGPVMVRDALANSLNLPAVRLLSRIGCNRFYTVLDQLGLINDPGKGPDQYGLGMVVGNAEVNLLELAGAYAALATGGVHHAPRLLSDAPLNAGRRAFSPQAAWIVTSILSEPASRAIVFGGSRGMTPPYHVAIKTGTSSDYRDCWVAAYTPRFTAVVWVGNFNGRPMEGVTGSGGAAPILADILAELHRLGPPPAFEPPEGVVQHRICSFSGMKPHAGCPHTKEEWFIEGTEPREPCTYHRERDEYHEIPVRYAGWLAERHQKGIEGRLRISGFDDNLDKAFEASLPPKENDSEIPPQAASGPAMIAHESAPSTPPAGVAMRRGADRPPLSIASPRDGSRYLKEGANSSGNSVIKLSAVCEKPYADIVWFIDGMEYARTGPPYAVDWPMERGRHRIAAVGPEGLGSAVEIDVQ
jgi:penicillin-binding protein 1C